MTIRIQVAPRPDNIAANGTVDTQLPYPFICDVDGEITNLSILKRVVGFADDLAAQHIDLWWGEYERGDHQACIGKYVVTEDNKGGFATHTTAVMEVSTND